MLSDIERKIFRIIVNYSYMQKRMPTIKEIQVRTGRNRAGVCKVLAVLATERYIEWSEGMPDFIILLEEEERHIRYQPTQYGASNTAIGKL